MNIPPTNNRATESERDVQPDPSVAQQSDATARQNRASTSAPSNDRPSLLQRAVSIETQRRLQLQRLSVVTPAATQAVAVAQPHDDAMDATASIGPTQPTPPPVSAVHSPRMLLQGRPQHAESFDVAPHLMARRLTVQTALAEFGSPSPGSGFSAMLRRQGMPINLPPPLNLSGAPELPPPTRHSPAQRFPAPGDAMRRGRALAFDESVIPPGLRPPRLIRDAMRYPTMTLEDSVASWTTTCSSEALAVLQVRWRDISAEDGALTFGDFLAKLNKNINADNLPFRQQTAELLEQLSNDSALRQQVFAISVEATTSCEDRVSHAMVMMQTAARAAKFRQTEFASDADALLVQRQFHRLDLLHDTARAIVEETGNGLEELETHLHLLIRHVDALALTGVVPAMDMRWNVCSHVSDERSAMIPAEIKHQENEEFAGWLTHSPSWLDYIARTDKARFDTAQYARDTLFDTAFQPRLDARLAETGLDKEAEPAVWADAERVLGKAVSEEMIDEINVGLTKEFLAARGNLHLVDRFWPEHEHAVTAAAADVGASSV